MHLVDIPPFWTWEMILLTFCCFLQTKTLLKRVYSKRKELAPSWSKFFSFRVDPFQKGARSILKKKTTTKNLSPLTVSLFLLNLSRVMRKYAFEVYANGKAFEEYANGKNPDQLANPHCVCYTSIYSIVANNFVNGPRRSW